MMAGKPVRWLLTGVLVLWGTVTLAAFAGMYKLWWDRERVSYLGKTVEEQRAAIQRNAGLPEKLLATFDNIQKAWPKDNRYTASGDHNQLSYLKYLLIPRIPSGSSEYAVDAGGVIEPASAGDVSEGRGHDHSSILALMFPLAIFTGMTLMLKKRNRSPG